MPEGQKPEKGEEPVSTKNTTTGGGSAVAGPTRPVPPGVFVPPDVFLSADDQARKAKDEEVRRDIDSLKASMGEIMDLLRTATAGGSTGVTFKKPQTTPEQTKPSDAADEAMADIESLSLPEGSVPPQRQSSVRLELTQTALKVPVYTGISDLNLRTAFKKIAIWHYVVTQDEYRNKLSTLEVIRQLTDANIPKANHSAKYHAFHQSAQDFVTIEAIMASDGGIDEALWTRYTTCFKSFLMPDVVDERNAVFRKLFYRTRPKQTSVVSAISLFRQHFIDLCSLDSAEKSLSNYVSHQFYYTALLNYLDLSDPILDGFRRRFEKKISEGIDHADLLDWLQSQLSIEKLVAQERSRTKKIFNMENDESSYGGGNPDESAAGMSTLDITDFDLPKGGKSKGSESGDYHSQENANQLQKQKVYLGTTSFDYDPQAVLTSHFAEQKSKGINRFPKGFKKNNKTSAQNRKQLVEELAKQLGSSCTRCLRASCKGSTSGWRDAPCAQEGSTEYVSYALCQVLFHLVKFLFGPTMEVQSKSAVKNFYLQKGISITSDKVETQKRMQTWLVNSIKHYFSCHLSDYYYARTEPDTYTVDGLVSQSFLTLCDESSNALKERALRAMPDTGCPEYIAGLCWWKDYASLLREANLLDAVVQGEAPGTYAFGDSPQKQACFRALQVPLFYKKVSRNNESLLVFANITIVDNEVGLLAGKLDMSALKMQTLLKSNPGSSRFWLWNTEIETQDTVPHFWFMLNQPRQLTETDTGVSIQKRTDGRAVGEIVSAEKHHKLSDSFDPTVKVMESKYEIHRTSNPVGSQKLSYDIKSECDWSENISEDEDPDTSSSIDIGIFEEILGDIGEDLDTDSEYEFDEEWQTFVKTNPEERNEKSKDSNPAIKAFAIELASVEMSKENTTELIARLWDLHKSLNHPAPSQLLVILQNSLPDKMKLPAEVSRAIQNLDCPRCLKNSRHNRVPSRPTVTVPTCTAPGQVADMDTGSFESPTGKFTGVLHVDEFSLKVSGGVFTSLKPSAEDMVRKYVETIDEYYENILVDLEGCFDSKTFSSFLEKQGTGLRFVPTGAHWANKAEKAVELVKVELASVFEEYPLLANDLAFKLAILSVNRRVMTQYKISRLELHWGRKAPTAPLKQLPLSAFTDVSLTPSLKDIDKYLECALEKKSEKVRTEARRRLRQATKNRFPAKDPVELGNGDEFLIFHNDPVSKAKSGFRGVFVCLGQVRSLIVGMRGRFIVTAHPSRVLLHKRGPHGLALSVSENGILPQKRTLEWEKPLLYSDFGEFMDISSDEDILELGNNSQLDAQSLNRELDIQEINKEVSPGQHEDTIVEDTAITDSMEILPLDLGQESKEDDLQDVQDLSLPLDVGPEAKEDDLPDVEDLVLPDSVNQANDDVYTGLEDIQIPSDKPNHSEELGANEDPSPLLEVQELLLPMSETERSLNDQLGQLADVDIDPANTGEDHLPFALRDSSQTEEERGDALEDIVLPEESQGEEAARSILDQIILPHEHKIDRENDEVLSNIPEIRDLERENQASAAQPDDSGLTEIDELLLSELEQIAEAPTPNDANSEVPPEGSRKRTRDEDLSVEELSESPTSQKQRLHECRNDLSCPLPGDVELERRLQQAKQKYRNKSPQRSTFPNPGVPTEIDISQYTSGGEPDSEIVYCPSQSGMGLRRVFLCDNSRKRTVVHDYEEAMKIPGMREAMELEINTFKRFGVLEECKLSDIPADTNLISTRWILSTKTNPDGSKRRKARLVARGFEDSEKENISRDSPVASNATQRLVLQVLAEKQWLPQSFDFLSAFLQGKRLERTVVIAPPSGFGTPDGWVWVIKKPIYGLCSAPKAWYDALLEVCIQEGFNTDVSDEGVMRLLQTDGTLVGILALHVDDAIGGGTEALNLVMTKVGEKLQIGSHEVADGKKGFFYKGLQVTVSYHNIEPKGERGEFDILLDGNHYLDTVLQMEVPAGEDDRDLSPAEAKDFRSVAGCIGYLASAFRVDLAVETSILGRSFFAPKVKCAKKANAVVAFAKEHRYVLRFKQGVEKLLVFADAAGPDEKGTQAGRIYALSDLKGEKIAGFAHWESRKNTRVCRSTSTAEILTVGDALDSAIWLQKLWSELTGQQVQIEIITDSGGTLKNSTTTKLPVERRNRIDMSLIRQSLKRGEYKLTWVPSRANLADPLTKETDKRNPGIAPDYKMKKVLLDALRTNNSQLKGVSRKTRTKEDVSKY